jgi:hypothetical protein
MGRGRKSKILKKIVGLVKRFDKYHFLHNTPKLTRSLTALGSIEFNIDIVRVFNEEEVVEIPPIIWNHQISKRFTNLLCRIAPHSFVAKIPFGKVAGESSNWIILPDGTLSVELSREFGAYGGLNLVESRLIVSKLIFRRSRRFSGSVAVITTCGYNNFHHWNYDCISRLHTLMQVMNLDDIDYFIIHHSNLPYQLQSLELLGIQNDKIISINEDEVITADLLIIPSLPSPLGTVSPWVVRFLRGLYLKETNNPESYKRIYISRKNVKSRKVKNNDEFWNSLRYFGFTEIFPEDYSVMELAGIVNNADVILSIHGSGLSNICFISPNTTVVDILAPFHQDAYYWQISNLCHGRYIGFFAEGDHPDDDLDLVKLNIDDDLIINVTQLNELLEYVVNK